MRLHPTLPLCTLLLAAPAAADHVVLLAGDEDSRAQESLYAFAETELVRAHDLELSLLVREESGHVDGIEKLREADLLVAFLDEAGVGQTEGDLIDEYVASGRPLVLVRGTVAALKGHADFHKGVTGANYLGTAKEEAHLLVGRMPEGEEHPIVEGWQAFQEVSGPLHRVTPLAETAQPLLWCVPSTPVESQRPVDPEPVAWLSGFRGANVFVTTLGAPADFAIPAFRAVLRRGILWCLGRENLSGDEDVPVLDETNSASLFDGESLQGWTTQGGRYDGNARWNVEDGAIVGRQGPNRAGGLIYTDRPYKNFIVSFETWIDYPFDSGVFLHMVPRNVGGKGIQVTLDYRPGGEVGGLYADGFLQHNPDSTELLKRDAWNRVTVRCKGDDMHVTAWLNGELLCDYETPPGTEGFADTGLIGLQVHGGEHVPDTQRAMFRDVRIRELPDYDQALFTCDDRGLLTPTEAGAAAGWESLFNGRDLEGWDPRPGPEGYQVEEGELVFPVSGGHGEIRSLRKFRDLELRLDFKIAKGANSGLFLRAAPEGNPAFSGCEIQIIDDFNWEKLTDTTLQPYQFSGGLYGAHAPEVTDALNPIGVWNTYEVRYVGSRIRVALNGRQLYDIDTFTLEKAKPPFQERAERGFIGLQRHSISNEDLDAFAWFRNLYVREIEEPAGD